MNFVNFIPSNQPFLRAIFAWEKGEDGRIYYAYEAYSAIFIRDALTRYGRGAVRNFRRNVKAGLAEKVQRREFSVASELECVSVEWFPARSREELLRLLQS